MTNASFPCANRALPPSTPCPPADAPRSDRGPEQPTSPARRGPSHLHTATNASVSAPDRTRPNRPEPAVRPSTPCPPADAPCSDAGPRASNVEREARSISPPRCDPHLRLRPRSNKAEQTRTRPPTFHTLSSRRCPALRRGAQSNQRRARGEVHLASPLRPTPLSPPSVEQGRTDPNPPSDLPHPSWLRCPALRRGAQSNQRRARGEVHLTSTPRPQIFPQPQRSGQPEHGWTRLNDPEHPEHPIPRKTLEITPRTPQKEILAEHLNTEALA